MWVLIEEWKRKGYEMEIGEVIIDGLKVDFLVDE